jgi:hypothetical protein
MDFGLGSITGDYFLVKLDSSDGSAVWNHAFGGARGISDMVCDDGNSIVMVGDFQGNLDMGGGLRTSFSGSYDIFAAKYERAGGQYRWDQVVTDYDQQGRVQRGRGVGADATGRIVVGGSFEGVINPGTGILTSGMGFGGSDGVLIKMAP